MQASSNSDKGMEAEADGVTAEPGQARRGWLPVEKPASRWPEHVAPQDERGGTQINN